MGRRLVIPFFFEQTEGKPGGSSLLDKFIVRLEATLDSLAKAVTNERLLTVALPVATTDVTVLHGLGAPVLTWEVVDRNANAVVWRSPTVNARPRDTLILQASAPVTVLIRVI
jgi:hypothetical protein